MSLYDVKAVKRPVVGKVFGRGVVIVTPRDRRLLGSMREEIMLKSAWIEEYPSCGRKISASEGKGGGCGYEKDVGS